MDNWFEELSSMRKGWVESTRRNDFEKGIRHSTVEKYPDPVHFLYELLQNAEDQGATRVQFQLFSNQLAFSHNGSPFTRQDVKNITSIGSSDKPQEANKIGRFGIGFKSVFAITDRPEIYTMLEGDPFSFAIEDLVIPINISSNNHEHSHFSTRFVFPFSIGQEASFYSKVKRRLSNLGFETLLFLRNLSLILWQTDTDQGEYLCERKGIWRELSGKRSRNGQIRQTNANYLVFTKNTSLNENGRELDVSVAFRLDDKGRILSEPDQKLFVYFPTEQVTGLNFRLHGPFLLTDNRANIKKDNKTNSRLIQECALLLADTIQKIKKENLFTTEFLSMLPICRENVQSLFLPLYEQTLRVLKRYRLLPTTNGTFASTKQIKIARGTDLCELVNEQQLSTLYGASGPLYWLNMDITEDRTHDLYTYIHKELEVEVIDPETFVRKLEKIFLEKQTDEWLVRLFIFLNKQSKLRDIIKWKPILRLKDNSHVSPFRRTSLYDKNEIPNAYLLREGKSKFPLVKKSLLADDVAYAFLKKIGLAEPSIADEVLMFVIPPYEANEVTFDKEKRYRQNLHQIQQALQHVDSHRRQELISKLSAVPFIRASNAKTSTLAWKTPREVYGRTKELLTWFADNEQAWFITGSLSKAFLGDLSIQTHIQPGAIPASGTSGHTMLRTKWGFNQRGLHGFDPNASLDGLQQALDNITSDKAKILWNILLKYRYLIKGVVETSNNKDFRSFSSEERYSPMGRLCTEAAWLPNRKGEFCIPEELFLSDLPQGFEADTNEARELAMMLGMRKAEELQLADKLGIPYEIISLIQRNPEAALTFYQQHQRRASLPSSIANDPMRRTDKAAEVAYNAPVKAFRGVSMNRRVSAKNSDAKIYLRNHHTNTEGQLICQLCKETMPFKLPNGEEYFEAYQYIEHFEKEYEANHLALCPNCAAEFRYACQTGETEKADLILSINPMTSEENLVVILDMPIHRHLHFTQRHLIDLQMAIKDGFPKMTLNA